MTDITVRPATLDDVEFLSQTAYQVHIQGKSRLSPQDQARWLDGFRDDTREQVLGGVKDSVTYVIQSGAVRAGRLRVVRTADRIFLAGIQLRPEHQNKGIGTTVIGELLSEAAGKGLPVELKVAMDNPDAERLYTRLGFGRNGEDGDDYCMIISQPRSFRGDT